jgi:hypothetical protein
MVAFSLTDKRWIGLDVQCLRWHRWWIWIFADIGCSLLRAIKTRWCEYGPMPGLSAIGRTRKPQSSEVSHEAD